MIEIVEIIWKHHEEEEAAAALSLQQVPIEGWTTTTMDVGGASFALVKPLILFWRQRPRQQLQRSTTTPARGGREIPPVVPVRGHMLDGVIFGRCHD
jgi:hypothetical protein